MALRACRLLLCCAALLHTQLADGLAVAHRALTPAQPRASRVRVRPAAMGAPGGRRVVVTGMGIVSCLGNTLEVGGRRRERGRRHARPDRAARARPPPRSRLPPADHARARRRRT